MTGSLIALLVLLGLLLNGLFYTEASAQEENQAPSSFWQAELPGGNMVMARGAVSSIARTRYLVDGAMRVHEVSVGTLGSVEIRFYFMEPVTPQAPLGVGQSGLNDLRGRLSEAPARTGMSEVESEVLKTYPVTTHAHTVEYRMASIEQLDRLYQHLERWLTRGGSGRFRLEESP
jgi:hypothetical protein